MTSAQHVNRVEIDGVIQESEPLRHTPAGIAIVKLVLRHASMQREAGGERTVEIDLACVATEADARFLAAAPLGSRVKASGFLAAKSKSSRQLVLHISEYEFPEHASQDKETNDGIR